jgi:hypothetical protein
MKEFTLAELESLPTIRTRTDGSLLKVATEDVRISLLGSIALVQEFKVLIFGGRMRWFLTQVMDLREPVEEG